NNTLRLLPGGAALARAYRYFRRVSAPPPGNSNLKPNTTRTPGMMKKLFALPLVAPFLVSFSSKNGDSYKQPWVKDTNPFYNFNGQFSHKIHKKLGFKQHI
ncbi:hypothetical protein ACVGW6_09125, partial [Enterobacter intestinihominis]